MTYDKEAVKAELGKLSMAVEMAHRKFACLLWATLDVRNSSFGLIRYDNHIVDVCGVTQNELFHMLSVDRLQPFATIEHTPIGSDSYVSTVFTGKPVVPQHWFKSYRKVDGSTYYSCTIAEAEVAHNELLNTHP